MGLLFFYQKSLTIPWQLQSPQMSIAPLDFARDIITQL